MAEAVHLTTTDVTVLDGDVRITMTPNPIGGC